MSDRRPYKVSDRMPQPVSDRIPKKICRIYARYCQSRNVGIYVRIYAAVGITRNHTKRFFLYFVRILCRVFRIIFWIMLRIQFFKIYEAVLLKAGYRKSMIYGCALKDVNKNNGISGFELSNLHQSKIIGEMFQHRERKLMLLRSVPGEVLFSYSIYSCYSVLSLCTLHGAGVPVAQPIRQPLNGCGMLRVAASTAAKMIRNRVSIPIFIPFLGGYSHPF